VRIVPPRPATPRDLRRRLDRVDFLPLRPATAWSVLVDLPDEVDEKVPDPPDAHGQGTVGRPPSDLDPAWAVAESRAPGGVEPLGLIGSSPWWRADGRDQAEALGRLWRHSVAVSFAARRLARDAREARPDRLARAGLLHNLGLWGVAAVDPDWLVRWLALDDAEGRRGLEQAGLGLGLEALGRDLADRWGCEPLVGDACRLIAPHSRGLEAGSAEPERVALLREAYRLAERTPWSIGPSSHREGDAHDPMVKLLTAEVQARCGGPFVGDDVSPHEERLSRSNARLRLRVAELSGRTAARDRLIQALAETAPSAGPETWADRAALAWCGKPGVASARVIWTEPTADIGNADRPPSVMIPLGEATRGRLVPVVQLWDEPGATDPADYDAEVVPAWRAWAALVSDRDRLEGHLRDALWAHRRQNEGEVLRLRKAKLAALAEFAAGAGHELNNPLAVIVGRAQLLLLRETDPKAVRSLRAILTQAQRTHRILRDLMYVARPPETRPRFCHPDDLVRASLRDLRADAEDREVRLSGDPLDHAMRVWADPDGLRHLADTLLRNALEASSRGGSVRFVTGGDSSTLQWAVHDGGRGITPTEAAHLFDPFYCGRQAGRGLGMGLPRAARFVAQLGGELRWDAAPGQGSTFRVRIPLSEPPLPPALDIDTPHRPTGP